MIMRVSRIILGFGGFAEKILFMLLHFVVLPYAFLMNTRYNKNRIINEGWLNVLKNMANSYNCNNTTLDNDRSEALPDDENINKAQIRQHSQKIFSISNTSQSSMAEEIVVSNLPSAIDGEKVVVDVEMQQPTCSHGNEMLTNDSDDCSDEGRRTKATACIATSRENMISGLISDINDEDKYVQKLTYFVGVEEAYACGNNIDTLNYEYEQITIDTLPHFVGCSVRKLNMRTNKLQMLLRCRKENDNYKIYFDQFVEMEENFLENGC